MLIPASVFESHRVTSDDHSRYVLRGVRFRRISGKPYAEATNGKIMSRVTWDEWDHEEYPVDPNSPTRDLSPKPDVDLVVDGHDMAKARKIAPKGVFKPVLENVALDEHDTNGTATFTSTDLDSTQTVSAKVIDGTYPNVDSVIEHADNKEKLTVLMDPASLHDAVDALIKISGRSKAQWRKEKDSFVELTVDRRTDSGPMRMRIVDKDRAQTTDVYIMPCVKSK